MKFKKTFELDSLYPPIIAIDVGTGTQDIFLSGWAKNIENSPKMVFPSPTVIVAEKIRNATSRNNHVYLFGVTMGGGPVTMAIKEHLKNGLRVLAIPLAAKTIDDDLEKVKSIGIEIAADKDVVPGNEFEKIETKDVFLDEISGIIRRFGIDLTNFIVAVAVQDHGEAPDGMSDRKFRFEHLKKAIESKSLLSQSYFDDEIPDYLTRMKSAAKTIINYSEQNRGNVKDILLMDTGIAAIIGASEDEVVNSAKSKVIINIGNGHTLGVAIENDSIMGLFENHSGSLDAEKLDSLISKLCSGIIKNEDVYEDGGHGACTIGKISGEPLIAVTGPRRQLALGLSKKPYFAAPYGDMMLSGCFGLVKAFKNKIKEER